LKANGIRELSIEELHTKELDLNHELVNLRVQAVMGQTENPTRIKIVRRDLARVKTILRENELSLK